VECFVHASGDLIDFIKDENRTKSEMEIEPPPPPTLVIPKKVEDNSPAAATMAKTAVSLENISKVILVCLVGDGYVVMRGSSNEFV